MKKLISYFADNHLLTNFIVFGTIIGAVFAWNSTSKEAMPDVTMDFVIISGFYQNASPENVEFYITKPIEDSLKGIEGIKSIRSTSTKSSCSIFIELEDNPENRNSLISEITTAVSAVDLPSNVDPPKIREIKSSMRAILDIGLVNKSSRLLNYAARATVQNYAEILKGRLEGLPEVNEVNISGFLDQDLLIRLDPEKLKFYDISINEIISILKENNIRKTAGTLSDSDEISVSIISELNSIEKIRELIIRATFEGATIRLKQVANVEYKYEEVKTITKYNGYEGLKLNVIKSSSFGIIEANEAVNKELARFNNTKLKESNLELYYFDDESLDVKERLHLISVNGLIGFILILVMLFIFLNFSSAFWVAIGIPFTFCITMIFIYYSGYTINNMTLAAVIIVMGMVVDDAIIVAENITRLHSRGVPKHIAVIDGTDYVIKPIFASIITTCIAFLPLYFFSGRMGKFIQYIPLIIILMLGGSLFEALFILPSHMRLTFKKKGRKDRRAHWFEKVENVYGSFLQIILKARVLIYILLILLLASGFIIFNKKMKFVMFPREEATEVRFSGWTEEGTDKYETALIAGKAEDIIMKNYGEEVTIVETTVARSRHGRDIQENRFNITVEIVSAEKREKSLKELSNTWIKGINQVEGIEKFEFARMRFGQSSGSAIEIKIQENDDRKRYIIAERLSSELKKIKDVENISIDESRKQFEYKLDLKKDILHRLDLDISTVTSTISTALGGTKVFEISNPDSETDVIVTVADELKDDINKVLRLPVSNKSGYNLPLGTVFDYEKQITPSSIQRQDSMRTLMVYADLTGNTNKTPLEVAEYLENNVFPKLLSEFQGAFLSFEGEIKDTRESGNEIIYSILTVILLIYVILTLLFKSFSKSLVILLTIPFGAIGVIFTLYLHKIFLIGFFSAIGLIGLAGVVVNDSIVMLVKLEREFMKTKGSIIERVSQIAQTRLRAVFLTTITTVAGLLPTAYGIAGYDSMLSDMMLVMAWGLVFGTIITLILIPMIYCSIETFKKRI